MNLSMLSVIVLLCMVAVGAERNAAPFQINIDTSGIIIETEEEFLSICLDPYLKHDFPGKPWNTLDFTNQRLHTLAKGLSPAILRFGGTDADWSIFYNVSSPEEQQKIWQTTSNLIPKPGFIVPFFPQDIDNLHTLAKLLGGPLLLDLDIQKRFGSQWDPTNAYELMRYIQEQGYAGDMAFELGNEPNYPELSISGSRIGQDVLILKKLLSQLKGFENVKIVGPDIGVATGGNILKIAQDFAATVKKNITAYTLHHYYFRGPGANVSQFLDVKTFNMFGYVIEIWRNAMWAAAGEKVDVWVGETSDSYNYGTPNVTNKYISGLLWLDKLGTAAVKQYKLVARQDLYGGNYPLLSNDLYPNPDYWLSYVFKRLVGTKVLNVQIKDESSTGPMRVYAHCTSNRALYPPGSVTIYLINLVPDQMSEIFLDPKLFGTKADLFMMQPGDGKLLSDMVYLNGYWLHLLDDATLPPLKPVEYDLNKPIKVQQYTYNFIVLKDAKFPLC